MKTVLENGQRILFTGDSITDCGRRDAQHRPLGCGYVQMFSDMLKVREPGKGIDIVNTGIGGNIVDDLRSRWSDDVLSYKPDFLSIKIGINDCHCWVTNKRMHCSVEDFERIYDEILVLTSRKLPGTRILLIDPFYAGVDDGSELPESFRGRVSRVFPEYLGAVERMSVKHKTLHVRTHSVFSGHFKVQHPSVFFPNEPVHPNSAGHLLIAEEVYRTLSEC